MRIEDEFMKHPQKALSYSKHSGVFRTKSNIYDGAFSGKQLMTKNR